MAAQYSEPTHLAPALPAVHEHDQVHHTSQRQHQQDSFHTSNEVHATDYGHTSAPGTGHQTPAGSAYPQGEAMNYSLSGAHHPHGPADPLAAMYPGARRSKQQQVTGLGRAMPTYEEIEMKKAAEKRRREGYSNFDRGHTLPGAGTVTALDSIADPNLRIVLAEILNGLHGGVNGSMTPYTMSPPLSRMQTREARPLAAGGLQPLSRVQTALTVAEMDAIILPEEDPAPNPIKKMVNYIREPAAEFLGTALILLFGNGVNQQFFLSSNPGVSGLLRGTYLSVSFGWGIGVMCGVYVAGGISGAHLNPAVTASLAVYRKFPWKKVVPYILAQVLGALTGSAFIYLIYNRATSIYQGGPNIRTVTGAGSTAGLYTTFPLAYMGVANSFFNEFLDTAILILVIFAIGDSNNTPPPDGMAPIVLLFLILGIGACLGSQTAYAINPARDMGPRLMLWMAGYGTEVWSAYNYYFAWCPLAAPMLGGLAGGGLYDLFLYKGLESPMNARWGKQGRKQREEELAMKQGHQAGHVDLNEKSSGDAAHIA